ncbi:Serine phosphatase RsbU, regulator of sigma subunit [hydrothermal vent metagenome]|uniref:Serine phosphatase RsbU, regulator of sigma subunit n=1 Tax=hydrothermal vent metagenome TaxID=652676 RepID=A0A3B0ZHH4_9ZZZZ
MKALLKTISKLRYEDDASSKLFHSISQQLRKRYGDCAIALMVSSDSVLSSVRLTLLYDHTGSVCVKEHNVLQQKNCLKIFSGDFLKLFLNESEPAKFKGEKYGIDSIFNDIFKKYIDAITFPIFHYGDECRWFVLLFPRQQQLEKVDIERTLLVSTLIINYIESIEETKKLHEANEWIAGELKSVAKIKQQLLPQGNLTFNELSTAVLYEPYQLSGGDYYDIARLTDFLKDVTHDTVNELFGIIIADASGHGTASAVEISMFDAILRTYQPSTNSDPAGLFNYANKYLFTRLIRNGFITAFVSSYQSKTHILSYANAGHPAPIVKRANNNSIELLSDNIGIPLGIEQGKLWQSSEIIINKDDILVVYTDGITELLSPQGEMFGEQQLINIIQNSSNKPDILLSNIKSALKTHQAENSNSDDLTLLIIQPKL